MINYFANLASASLTGLHWQWIDLSPGVLYMLQSCSEAVASKGQTWPQKNKKKQNKSRPKWDRHRPKRVIWKKNAALVTCSSLCACSHVIIHLPIKSQVITVTLLHMLSVSSLVPILKQSSSSLKHMVIILVILGGVLFFCFFCGCSLLYSVSCHRLWPKWIPNRCR